MPRGIAYADDSNWEYLVLTPYFSQHLLVSAGIYPLTDKHTLLRLVDVHCGPKTDTHFYFCNNFGKCT